MVVPLIQKPLVKELDWLPVLRNNPRWTPPSRPTLVISPHPDDETLGVGGLIASQVSQGIQVNVVAVTDGEAAYPHCENDPVCVLAAERRREQSEAAGQLGLRNPIIRLSLPDSRLEQHESELEDALSPYIEPGMLVLAPWINDWHPDHEACARVAQKLCRQRDAQLISYLFWTWHRRTLDYLQFFSLLRFELSPATRAAKMAALNCHQSQLQHASGEPILPEQFLAPALRTFETFISHA